MCFGCWESGGHCGAGGGRGQRFRGGAVGAAAGGQCFPGAAVDNLALAAGAGAVLGHMLYLLAQIQRRQGDRDVGGGGLCLGAGGLRDDAGDLGGCFCGHPVCLGGFHRGGGGFAGGGVVFSLWDKNDAGDDGAWRCWRSINTRPISGGCWTERKIAPEQKSTSHRHESNGHRSRSLGNGVGQFALPKRQRGDALGT